MLKYLSYRFVQWMVNTLPTASAFHCAELLADMQRCASTKDRHAVQANLSLILGRPIPEDSPLVREAFRNFSRYLVEFFASHRVQQPEVILDGYEHLTDTLHRDRGAIVLTAHLGNWELLGVSLHRMGVPITAVALPHDDPRMDRLFNQQRQRCGVRVIPLGPDAARRSLEILRQGGVLGLLADREFANNGIRITLCGREVIFPRGPATVSLRSRSPAVPTFLIREGLWKFRLCCEPPIWPTVRGSVNASIQTLTQMYAAAIERHLKRFPDQWLVFQPLTQNVDCGLRSADCEPNTNPPSFARSPALGRGGRRSEGVAAKSCYAEASQRPLRSSESEGGPCRQGNGEAEHGFGAVSPHGRPGRCHGLARGAPQSTVHIPHFAR